MPNFYLVEDLLTKFDYYFNISQIFNGFGSVQLSLFYSVLIIDLKHTLNSFCWMFCEKQLSFIWAERSFGLSDLFNCKLSDTLIRVPTFPQFSNNIVDGQLSTHAGPDMYYRGRGILISRPRFINNMYLVTAMVPSQTGGGARQRSGSPGRWWWTCREIQTAVGLRGAQLCW